MASFGTFCVAMALMVLAELIAHYVSLILSVGHFDLDLLSKFLLQIISIGLEPIDLESLSPTSDNLGARVF
jgi:hypothetical protein